MIDWQNFFKASDFTNPQLAGDNLRLHDAVCNFAKDIANQKLWVAIQTSEQVYGYSAGGQYHGIPMTWSARPNGGELYVARIVDARKL